MIMGTRPEAIKMAPVVSALRARPREFDPVVVATAQHREMLDQVLEIFDIVPEVDLNLMTAGQSLAGLTARLLTSLEQLWTRTPPDAVLVQGDTTSTFVASLVAFYLRIPIGHVEAGLRTGDKFAPFPEEMNRRLADVLADWYFAPTATARDNLLREGVPEERIRVTGNTGIDALFHTLERNRRSGFAPAGLDPAIERSSRLILVTAHRRESFGAGLESICDALARIARERPDAAILYPVHLNPNVRGPVFQRLGTLPNVFLTEPLDYRTFAHLMAKSRVILTDSGGIQEEAPSFGIPVLVMRDVTERVEAVAAGTAEIVGTSVSRIVKRTLALLEEAPGGRSTVNPFGDGHAAERIVQVLAEERRQPVARSAGGRTS